MSDKNIFFSSDINEFVGLNDQQKHKFEEEAKNDLEFAIQLYSLRWWIAGFFGVQMAVIRMIMNSFGIVNNIYKTYFTISYYAIDWFTLIQAVGVIISSVSLAFLSFNEITKFRKLFVMMVLMTMVPCVSLILSFAYPYLYALMYVGLFVAGFGLQTGSAISVALATNWFPENQIGTAMSFQSQGMAFGAFLAFLVPSQLVTPPQQNFSQLQDGNKTSQFEQDTAAVKIQLKNWKYETYLKFSFLYGCVLFICLIVLIFTLMFVSDYPNKPPTVAQALVRKRKNYNKTRNMLLNFDKFFSSLKSLLFDEVFFFGAIICFFVFSSNELQRLLMGQILRDVFIVRNYGPHINAMSGYVLMAYEAGSFFGNLFSGLLLDYFKKHKLILYAALIVCAFTSTGLTFGQYYCKVEVIFVCTALFGIAIPFCRIPIYDMVLEHTYPANPSFVLLLFRAQGEVLIIIISQVSRFTLDLINGTAVLIFMIVLITGSIVLTSFLNPKYKRREASKADQSSMEKQQLLNDQLEEV